MFYGLSHIDVPVRSLERSLLFYVDAIGFGVKAHRPGWVDVDTGTAVLRLLEVERVERSCTLRVSVSDVRAAHDLLLSKGAASLFGPERQPELEEASAVSDPDGHVVILWRELTEDEYGFDPVLPTQLLWHTDADALLKSLLRSVPALFRTMARRKVVRNAEHLARESEAPLVHIDQVVRAFILSSPKATRFRTRRPLLDHGFDPEKFGEEFDA